MARKIKTSAHAVPAISGVSAPQQNAVGVKELKDRASAILEQVATSRRSVAVTKNGKPIAEIVPVGLGRDQPLTAQDAVRRVADLFQIPVRPPLRKISGLFAELASESKKHPPQIFEEVLQQLREDRDES